MATRPLATAWLAAATVVVLMAADPGWKTKPASAWSEDDAKEILQASPWSVTVVAGVARRQGEDERRDGGAMGQPHGVGYDGVDPKGSGPKISPNIFTGTGGDDRSARSLPGTMSLNLRWESALPIRLADLKAHEIELPTRETEGYRIAIYGLPGGDIKGDPKRLGDPLRKDAALKRPGKKDVRPISVEVFQTPGGLAVVYVFPFSAEIVKADAKVEFEAQIGRIVVDHTFDLAEMEFQGKLEL
jgi:hypothetical protein